VENGVVPSGGVEPVSIAVHGRLVYVANAGDAPVSRIDAKTRTVFDTGGLSRATDLVAANGHLWAADGGSPGHVAIPPGTVADLEFGSGAIRTIRVGPDVVGGEEQTTLAAGHGGFPIWVGNADSETVSELDPSLDRIVRTTHGAAPGGLAPIASSSGGDAVWVSDPSRDVVLRIDGDTGRIAQRISVPGGPTRLTADDHAVWVISPGERTLTRIELATGEAVARIALPMRPERILLDDHAVWVSGYRWSDHRERSKGGLVLRIDPHTNQIVARIPLGDVAADGILVSRGLVWVAVSPTP
jgi:DNA-binding beta-propeller fold protein YncE